MDVGDIVSKAYLKEQGFIELWSAHEGKKDEVAVYHHKARDLDVKIERYYDMPDVYTIKVMLDVKTMKEALRKRVDGLI